MPCVEELPKLFAGSLHTQSLHCKPVASLNSVIVLIEIVRQPPDDGCKLVLVLETCKLALSHAMKTGTQNCMLPMIQIACSAMSRQGVITSHLPRWAKSSHAEAQGQDRSPAQGAVAVTSVPLLVSHTIIPQKQIDAPVLCTVVTIAKLLLWSQPHAPADVTNRLNGNKSRWKVPEDIQLFPDQSSQATGKPLNGPECYKYPQPHNSISPLC